MCSFRRWGCWFLVCVLAACSPALNWRQAGFDSVALRMLLPCKPDKADREVSMAGRTVVLQMQGCEADGATFAVSHVRLADASQAGPVLEGWRQAALAHLAAQDVQQVPWSPSGGWSLPQAVRLQARSARAGQLPVNVQAAWFARLDGGAAHLFHAIVLSPQPRADVAEAFFSGLALP